MKSRLVILIFVIVVLPSIAMADCLTCQRIGPLTNPAQCLPATEVEGDICSGICCYSTLGTYCTQPDYAYDCYGWVRASGGSYFATGRPLQERTLSVYLRIGNSLKTVQRPDCRVSTPLVG